MPSSSAAVEYIVENVGISVTQKSATAEYILENIGIEITQKSSVAEYILLGDVNTTFPNPVIWFISPSTGREGDAFNIYGLGLGVTQIEYTAVVEIDMSGGLGTDWQPVPVSNWSHVDPNADAYTANRVLDSISKEIDMEHTFIECVIPAGAVPPGYPIRVKTVAP